MIKFKTNFNKYLKKKKEHWILRNFKIKIIQSNSRIKEIICDIKLCLILIHVNLFTTGSKIKIH